MSKINRSFQITKANMNSTEWKKTISFYAIFILFSGLLAIIVVEVSLKFISISSGSGTGDAAHRWMVENWKPINQLGYRDFDITIARDKKQVIFLGDSFTAGHGVKFNETYYFQTSNADTQGFQYLNLGQPGASTKKERENLATFYGKYQAKPSIVIHQYFGNDVEDYVDMAPIKSFQLAPRPLPQLRNASQIVNLIENYAYIKKINNLYLGALYGAYADESKINLHLADINQLHNDIRKSGAKVYFLLFPFLNDDVLMEKSKNYINVVSIDFMKKCKAGDVLINATPLALELKPEGRVVNAMDAHPSPELHTLVAKVLINEINQIPKGAGLNNIATQCSQIN